MKLGVIIPYCQEWPQVAFTVRAIHEELRDIPHEIVVVDNMCEQAYQQTLNMGTVLDRGHSRIELNDKTMLPGWYSAEASETKQYHQSSMEAHGERREWMTYVSYSDRLSHWQAKSAGIAVTDAEILLFADAHTSPGRGCLSGMYNYYKDHHEELDGTLHAPLTYHILEKHKLIYKLVYERGLLGYSFTGYREADDPYEVPVMSTCGMMITRNLLEYLGGWPKELGIYGGGENFMNAALAVTGKKKWIMPGRPLHHHGDKRGYHYEWADHKRNQAIAMYLTDGEDGMWDYLKHLKPYNDKPELFAALAEDVMDSCRAHRDLLKAYTVETLKEWVNKWTV